jgi:hypothetical protein
LDPSELPVIVPAPLARAAAVVGLLVSGVLAAAGVFALRAPGVVAVGVAGLLAGLTAAAIARDASGHSVRSTVAAAALGAAGTVGALCVVAGAAALVGGAVTALLIGIAVVGWAIRAIRRNAARERNPGPPAAPGWGRDVRRLALLDDAVAGGPADGARPTARTEPSGTRLLPPVAALSTAALGREWLHTTAALAGRLDPVARRSIVDRREATLDELERRDPAGFGEWLALGPAPGSDPAEYVRGDPAAGTEAA